MLKAILKISHLLETWMTCICLTVFVWLIVIWLLCIWLPAIQLLMCTTLPSQHRCYMEGCMIINWVKSLRSLTLFTKWIALQWQEFCKPEDFEQMNHSSSTSSPRLTTQPAASLASDVSNLTAGCTCHRSVVSSTWLLGLTMSINALKLLWLSFEKPVRSEKGVLLHRICSHIQLVVIWIIVGWA